MAAHCRHTGKIVFFLAVLCLTPMRITADEAAPFILRASVLPDTGIWVGQRVIYQVDVLGRNGWAKIQHMPDVQASGVIIVPFDSQGTRLTETIGGESYTGQRYELSLFPQRSGSISVPSVTVDIEISQWGSQPQNQALQGAIPPVKFIAEMPPGSENVRGLISTEQLTADQQWEPDISRVAVGDAIQRSIHLKAQNVSAMAFIPVSFSDSDTIDVYPQAPTIEDRYDRGTLTGRRTEIVSYVFKNAGSVELPAVAITWWDLQNKKLRETVLPSRTIEISASGGPQNDPMEERIVFSQKQWFSIGMVVIVLIAFAGLFHENFRRRWNAWRRERNASEKACFRRFVKAAQSSRPTDTLNALMHWLARINTSDKAARLDQFLSTYSGPPTAKEAQRLYRAIDLQIKADWHGRKLIKGVTAARRSWLAQQRRKTTAHQRLPRLNP